MENTETTQDFKQGNIAIILDSLDDIFSDFDPRPSSQRALSDDFLDECQKMVKHSPLNESFELHLLLPKKHRTHTEETIIKKRIKDYFHNHYLNSVKNIRKMKMEGIAWFFIGSIIMFFVAFLLKYDGFIFDFLVIMGEPAGWFMFWEGLGKVFIDIKEKIPNRNFYNRMSFAKIMFKSY